MVLDSRKESIRNIKIKKSVINFFVLFTCNDGAFQVRNALRMRSDIGGRDNSCGRRSQTACRGAGRGQGTC